jgi:2-polyprenyl-6-hydroxyphenyl methylase/3-demethylubiquinone-9 3-methyltransferase
MVTQIGNQRLRRKNFEYIERKLSHGYPDIDVIAHETFTQSLEARAVNDRLERHLTYLHRLVDVRRGCHILVLGCGPRPVTLKKLKEMQFDAVGVEPVPSFVQADTEFMGSPDLVFEGEAENIPLPDASQEIVFFESVLEHVDSPAKSMQEIYRVLRPGGIAYVTTTNRYRFSLLGHAGEFNVRFFNWFPDLVKESYVFKHLHYDPALANGTTRPAVHWFSYADLCRVGRYAGFAQFYSLLDLLSSEDSAVQKSVLRKLALRKIQRNPWLRAMALSQVGGNIIMLKRQNRWKACSEVRSVKLGNASCLDT